MEVEAPPWPLAVTSPLVPPVAEIVGLNVVVGAKLFDGVKVGVKLGVNSLLGVKVLLLVPVTSPLVALLLEVWSPFDADVLPTLPPEAVMVGVTSMVGLELPPAPPAAVLETSPVVTLTGLVLFRLPLVKLLPPLDEVVSPTAPPVAALLAVWVWLPWVWLPLAPPVAELVLALFEELSSVMLGSVPELPVPVT